MTTPRAIHIVEFGNLRRFSSIQTRGQSAGCTTFAINGDRKDCAHSVLVTSKSSTGRPPSENSGQEPSRSSIKIDRLLRRVYHAIHKLRVSVCSFCEGGGFRRGPVVSGEKTKV